MDQRSPNRISRRSILSWSAGGALGLLGASLVAACSSNPATPTAVPVAASQPTAAPTPNSTTAGQPTVAKPAPTTAPAVKPTVAPPAPAQAAVDALTFMRPSSGGAESKAYEAMLQGWGTHHPNIKVSFVPVANADYETKMLTEIAGGVVRDVIGLTPGVMPVFAAKKAIVPLDPYVKSSSDLKIDDFFPAHWKNGQYQGQQYSIPPDGSPLFIVYNTELFQKNSVKPPAAGWTWDDCLKTCQSLTKKSGQRVTQFGGSFASNIFPWLFANDANAIDVNNSKVTIDQKSAVDTLAYLGDLVVKYHVNPTPSEQTEMGQNFFLTGKVGMVVANRGGIGTAYRAAPFKIDVAPIPNSPSTGHSGSQITPLQMAIETPNKHPDEAWLLLDYLASFESQITRFTMYGGYPSRKSVAADPRFASSVQPSWVGTEINTKVMDIAADKNTGFIPNHPNWSEMNDALNKHLDDLWGGKLPADTVAKAAAADMSKLIG